MQRRDFLKGGTILGLSIAMPVSIIADENNSRKFKITYQFDIQHSDKSFSAKLWNPIPFNTSYQKVRFMKFEGNYNDYDINTKNEYDAPTLYAQWNKSDKKKLLTLEMEVETTYRSVPLTDIINASKRDLPLPVDVKKYLKPTSHIPASPIIVGLAKRIAGDKTDRFEQVKAIYNWCTAHTFRDAKVIGCGSGDVGKMVTEKEIEKVYKEGYFGGKCTDLSSLFTAIVRAIGVPAREVFGIRLGKSHYSKALGKSDNNGLATISTWQHCRVEYYIAGLGWIPADPSDITKLELVEGLEYDDKKVQELNEKYLHSWEMNWVGFNNARDFQLYPKPMQYPLNMFGYPYSEVEDDVLNYYEPKEFGFTITSQEL